MDPLPFRKHPGVSSNRPNGREGLFALASAWRQSASVTPFPRPAEAQRPRATVADIGGPPPTDDGPAAA